MKIYAALMLLALVGMASATVQRTSLVAWSNSHMYTDGMQTTREMADSRDVAAMVAAAAGFSSAADSTFTQYFNPQEDLELALVLLAPTGTDLSKQTSLQSMVGSSQALAVPSVFLSEDITTSIAALDYTFVPAPEAARVADSIGANEFVNGATDLVVVDLREQTGEELEGTLARLSTVLESQAYVAILAEADSVTTAELDLAPSKSAYAAIHKVLDDLTLYDTYWPAYAVEIIVTSAGLLFITIVGFAATSQIQTPDQFETKEKRRDAMVTM